MLKTDKFKEPLRESAYHLGEGRVLKTLELVILGSLAAYHLGEGRVLKTGIRCTAEIGGAYHLGEGRVLKTRL